MTQIMQRITIGCFLMLLLTMTMSSSAFAQQKGGDRQHVVTWTATGLLAAKGILGYEYALNEQVGLRLGAGFMIPIRLEANNLVSDIDEGNFSDRVQFNGFDITPEIRFYLSKNRTAPTGFFIGPFYRYYKYKIAGDIDFDDDGVSREGKIDLSYVSPFNLGFNLGGQWISDSGFTSSLHFGLGGGIANVQISGSDVDGYTKEKWDEAKLEVEEWLADEANLDDVNGINLDDIVDVTTTDNSIKIKTPNFASVIVRFGFSIGYAF